jgi:predicted HAD superfamily Cof-like phosphohydrolase
MYLSYYFVSQFNEQILKLERPPLGCMPNDTGKHLFKCLVEEADEFFDAHEEGNFVGCVDSLIDSIYFAIGGLYKLGLNEEDCARVFELVHKANMTKVRGKKEGRITGDAADAIKPDEWVSPEAAIENYFFKD